MNSTKPMGTQTFLVKTTAPQHMILKKDINVKKEAHREEEMTRMGERQEKAEREIRMDYRYV